MGRNWADKIRRGLRDHADGMSPESHAYRMGFQRGFRKTGSMEANPRMSERDHADYRHGHLAGTFARLVHDLFALFDRS